ncbi:MAG: DEAD/DEAH box helicase [Bacteroidales bacterium]|nr:DEAD/DEAH box helicase [Bacteroidales bacterium]
MIELKPEQKKILDSYPQEVIEMLAQALLHGDSFSYRAIDYGHGKRRLSEGAYCRRLHADGFLILGRDETDFFLDPRLWWGVRSYLAERMPEINSSFDDSYYYIITNKLNQLWLRCQDPKVKVDLSAYTYSGPTNSYSFKVITFLMEHPEADWLWKKLAPGRVMEYFTGFINFLTFQDEVLSLDAPFLSLIDRIGSELGNSVEMEDRLNLYRYRAHGIYQNATDLSLRSPVAYQLKALYEATHSHWREAAATWAESFKLTNPFVRYKNIIGNPIDLFYQMMTYYHLEDKRHLTTLVNTMMKVKWESWRPIITLSLKLTQGLPMGPSLSSLDLTTCTPLAKALYILLANYSGLDDKQYKIPHGWRPNQKILQWELSSLLALEADEKERLEGMYGSQPALIRDQTAPWERMLDELQKIIGREEPAKRQNRIAYVMDSHRNITVCTQYRLKNGNWSVPKTLTPLSSQAYAGYKSPYMDEVDIEIRNAFSKEGTAQLRAETAFPFLVGTDRIYDDYRRPITIEKEDPYIIMDTQGDKVVVESNVSRNLLQQKPVSTILQELGQCHFSVIPLTEVQWRLLIQLLSVATFPREAEERLKTLLPEISKEIEIHSSSILGSEIVKGDSRLIVRVTPLNLDFFTVECRVRPFPEGKKLFLPGEGDEVFIDEAPDGTRHRVKRSLKREGANMALLSSALEEAGVDAYLDTDMTLMLEDILPLMDIVSKNPDGMVMEWLEGAKLRLSYPSAQQWQASLKRREGWFEIEGKVTIGDKESLSIKRLLEALSSRENLVGNYVRLSDSDFVKLNDLLLRQLKALETFTVKDHGQLRISDIGAMLIPDDVLHGRVAITIDDGLAQMRERLVKSQELHPEVPKALLGSLRGYQTEGFQWLARLTSWGAGACLADDMGLGKTVQTIAYLLHTASQGPALVVAPTSVVANWQSELHKFAPSLNVYVLNRASNRSEIVGKAGPGDVILSSYGVLANEAEMLSVKQWGTICLDEAHTIKNRDTQMSRAAMTLHAQNKIILTGTPIQNRLSELWNLFRFINPGLLGSYEEFTRRFITPIEVYKDKETSKKLQRLIHPFMLRRTKEEVVDELPEKSEVTLPVDLSDEEMAIYEHIRQRAEDMLSDEDADPQNFNVLAEITRLRQAACSPALVEPSFQADSSKTQLLIDLLESAGDDSNILVFSQFTSYLKLVADALTKQGVDFLYLDGSTPAPQRQKLVDAFQRGEKRVFLISLKAGGLGLNLTRANYVVHLDPWWNPAIEQQATDRAYRIGQRRNVTVYRLIAQHTIEEKILRLHATKRSLADDMLAGTATAASLSREELLEMLQE